MTGGVVVHPDADAVARATAARLLLHLLDTQSVRRPAHVSLTGGGVGIATLAAVAASPLRDAVDWSGVHLWWGDERFLPAGHEERNDTGARTALLDDLPIPAEQVHTVAGPDEVADAETAAARYADELARFASPGSASPVFDVMLLGIGPDGHVASLFPHQATLDVTDRTVVGVHDSPKPPPDRVSLTLPALNHATETWVVAAGEQKADAVRRALAGDDWHATPAAALQARVRTLWLVDLAAAGSAG
ncbi:6-phosphogluconolactonase [Isoptericola sp. b441]|uniref:6-phosphogluconolactonase n=1 Tax=Actinotalea lenta TaxID=3064654 RepID=A0ABT9D9V1_9CELL|nr:MULTISPECIES: 6-phosphogluconolactonase [unclassified Isoptericola]MDO8107677.1 6-phosphogluconolactonase [Isoptericola sp. b441]MDO8120663.1 6-phosphogluconolactonase [Isoptericola sp. b490]